LTQRRGHRLLFPPCPAHTIVPSHCSPMAIRVDDEIMKAIRAEVQSAVEKKWALHVQDVKSLREDFTSFQMSACCRSDLNFHLDAMKENLLQRIDEVQEQCDLDLMRNRRAVKSLQDIAKQVLQAKEEPSNENIKHPVLADEIDHRIEELKTNMLAEIGDAVKECANSTHQRIDKFRQCMERSLKVIRDRLDTQSATDVVAACSQLQQMQASMQKQLSEIEEEKCLQKEAFTGKLGSIIKSGGSRISVHM